MWFFFSPPKKLLIVKSKKAKSCKIKGYRGSPIMEKWSKSLGDIGEVFTGERELLQPCAVVVGELWTALLWGELLVVPRSCTMSHSEFCSSQFFRLCWTSTFQWWLGEGEVGLLLSHQHSKNWALGVYWARSFLLKFSLKSSLWEELMAALGFHHGRGKWGFPRHVLLVAGAG